MKHTRDEDKVRCSVYLVDMYLLLASIVGHDKGTMASWLCGHNIKLMGVPIDIIMQEEEGLVRVVEYLRSRTGER